MTYQKCKQILCNSELMGDIPDLWKEEVPFLVVEEDKKNVGFLYTSEKNGYSKIEFMILVDINSHEVKSYSASEIATKCSASTQYCKVKDIDNYIDYFLSKEKYEKYFASFVDNSCTGNKKDVLDMFQIFLSFFSQEQCEKVIYNIAESYIRLIQTVYEGV